MSPTSGPGPASTPFRWAEARHPFIYEINTWPWLAGLSAADDSPTDLSTVPDERWDAIADMGFDAVWLMGVWERSPAGVTVALSNDDLCASFTAALPDWRVEDVVGSPYCIRSYEVDPRLGGAPGLAIAREDLADRGLALILDFVPNHVAFDHLWTSEREGYFVHGTPEERRDDPSSFVEVDGAVLANGRDPYFPAWPDVVQLNAFSPTLRRAMARTLAGIADQCDGVRCDMAMLVMNDVFASTWGDRVGEPPTEDYWPEIIGAVRATHPYFTFLAEAYWDTEWALQQQGFDFCYDKRFYDCLVDGDGAALRQHLGADGEFQNGLSRFVENHDESRAAAVFDTQRHRAVTVAALTQTGARLVHHGQLEGRRVHLPVFLGRSPREDDDAAAVTFHRRLLDTLRDTTFRTGTWSPCSIAGDPGATDGLVSWCWDGEQRWLVVVNLGGARASGWVRPSWSDVDYPVELGAWGWSLSVVGRTDGSRVVLRSELRDST